MSDVLPQKRQTVVDRLRRRIEHYRRHQSSCLQRYNTGINGLLEHHHQDTILLRQRFLEAKAKKASKKSDHHHHKAVGVGAAGAAASAAAIVKDSSSVVAASGGGGGGGGNIGAQSKYAKRMTEVPLTPSPLESLTKTAEDCGQGVTGGGGDQQPSAPPPNNNNNSSSSSNNNNNNSAGSANQNLDQGLTQFSVEIVQQFTSPGQTQGQQIQTNVTVTAVSGAPNIKTSDSPLSNNGGNSMSNKEKSLDGTGATATTHLRGAENKSAPTNLNNPPVECKQEPKFDMDCGGDVGVTGPAAAAVVGTGLEGTNNEPNFSDTFPGFIDDSNDDDINLNFNSDTFNYLMDALPQDLMTAYLDRLEDEALDELKLLGADFHHHHHPQNKDHHHHHHHHNNGPNMNNNHHHNQHHHHHHQMGDASDHMSSMPPHNQQQQQQQQQPRNVSFASNNPTSGSAQSGGSLLFATGGVSNNNNNSMNPLGPNVNNAMGRIPAYGGSLGLDFSLKEPSPAAQTLKQMAEQHQSMQQKQQQQQQQQGLGMGMNASSPFSSDFGLSGNGGSSVAYGSPSNMDFLSSTVGNGFVHPKGASNNLSFAFGPIPPMSAMTANNGVMLKQDPMFRPNSVRQQSSAGHLHHLQQQQQHHHLPPHMDIRKQQMPAASPATRQRLGGADQKPGVGHSPGQSPVPGQPATAGASPGPCSTPGSIGSPLSFGATKPLTHFNDPQQQTSVNGGTSSPGAAAGGQFMHGVGVAPPTQQQQQQTSQQPQPSSANFMNLTRHGLQASQTQQMQVNQINSQPMQMTQGQHLQLNELKGQQQQQQVMYNFSQQQQTNVSGVGVDQYQVTANQSQSVTFDGGPGPGTGPSGGGGGSDSSMATVRMMMPQGQSHNPRLMHHQQQQQQPMPRHQKVSHVQQQQQPLHQQQRLSQFMNRPPPPDYNAQALPMGHQMVSGQQPQHLPQQQQQQQQQPGVMDMMNPMNQTQVFASSNVRAMSGQTVASRKSARTSPSPVMNQMLMNGRMAPGGGGNPIRPSSGYSSGSMLRADQRPPNVNIGPDGLNIGNRGMTSQEWRQMMVQNQAKFQSLSGGGGGLNAGYPAPSPSNIQGPIRPSAGLQRGYQGANQMNLMPMHHHQTQVGTGMMRGGTSGGQVPMMQQRQAVVNQMQNRAAAVQPSHPMITVQMSSSVTMSTGSGPSLASGSNQMSTADAGFPLANSNNGVGGGGGVTASSSSSAAASTVVTNDFNFDFFDSLSGPSMDGSGAVGFGPNVDTDLLNSFDSVMQNGSSALNLLEGL